MMQSDTYQMVVSAIIAVGAGMATYKFATNSKLASAGVGIAAYVAARMAVRKINETPLMGAGRASGQSNNTSAR